MGELGESYKAIKTASIMYYLQNQTERAPLYPSIAYPLYLSLYLFLFPPSSSCPAIPTLSHERSGLFRQDGR